MKRLLFSGFVALALARFALAAPTTTWINNGTTNCPPSPIPTIDATNFINTGQINLYLGNIAALSASPIVFLNSSVPAYDFSDVLYYTNRGVMTCDAGFLFNTQPSGSGSAHRAASFGNANVGIIDAGSVTNAFTTNLVFSSLLSSVYPSIKVSATNVLNAGTLDVGINGLLTVDGQSVDLTRGTLSIEGLQTFGSLFSLFFGGNFFGATVGAGIFDNYWGLGSQTNTFQSGTYTLPTVVSPIFFATNTLYQTLQNNILAQNASGFANVQQINASNISYQIVFVGNTNPAISTDVRFEPTGTDFAVPVIQWLAMITNTVGVITTNTIYLSDTFGSQTNFQLFTNNAFTVITAPQLSPTNFTFSTTFFGLYTNLPPGNTPFDPTLLAKVGGVTNQYAAYGVNIQPITFQPDPSVPGQNLTNIPGRIVINADNYLNMSRTKISGPNYLRLTSTNHFAGSPNAQIASPNMDINLGTTNGQLNITNLVAPYLPRYVGTIDAYSARWTNIVKGITNEYHVLVVGSQLSPTALPLVQNLLLRSTNVVISDIINVASNLLINAQTLTISSNAPDAPNPFGQLNLNAPNLLWQSGLPVLQYVTNFGIITVPNTVYFAQIGQAPYFTTVFTNSYQTFVNHGSIITSGNTTWANYFENTGAGFNYVIVNPAGFPVTTNSALIYSTFGPISVQANTAILANGAFGTVFGDVSITAGTLVISNHVLQVAGTLNLSITNQLTDGGIASSNLWQASDGVNLLVAPAVGDFLGTTLTLTAPAGFEVDNSWAGKDRLASANGFANNGALGHLILDAGDATAVFFFSGTDTNQHALYVDQIELRNGATNRSNINGIQNFTGLDFATNLTVYFADAVIGNFDISEKMNGANNNHLIWVPSYAGIFSSTNLVYPNGQTNTFNRALVQSTVIDSDGDGIVNAFDSTPIYTAANVNLSLSITNLPPKVPVLKWFSLAHSTNYLYYKTNISSTNWIVVTNFVQGAVNGNVTVLDRARTNSTGLYRVQVNALQP